MKKRNLAGEIACLIESISPLIEEHTKVVCPACPDVCCINRHSRYDRSDIIFLSALGEDLPSRRPGIPDSAPCQFIGGRGCQLKRYLRPYRCTWYFCTPLLRHIQEKSARDYRRFIGSLRDITEKRVEMLDALAKVADERDIFKN